MENMNKENFWDYLYETFPKAVQEFCNFIDEYKNEVNWENLFNARQSQFPALETKSPKYHDLPIELQFGLWVKFLVNQGVEEFSFDDGCFDIDNLKEWAYEHFREREIKLQNPTE